MRLRPLELGVRTRAVWVLALLVVALAGWTTIRETRRWRRTPFGDFNYLQTGARCLVAGCDPYDSVALNREAAKAHESRPTIWPMTPVYPPSSLLVLLPLEGMRWPVAAYVFDGLAGLLTAAACWLMVWRMRVQVWDAAALVLLAVLLTKPMAATLEFGNPALAATGLLTLGCLLVLDSDCVGGWVLLGLALALKPQLAAGAVLVLLCRRETRDAAARACALAIGLLVVGLLAYRVRLGSFHYLATLRWVLWLTSLPQATSDYANKESFDFLNLQTALDSGLHASRTMINGLTWMVTATLAGVTVWRARVRDALRRRPWTLIALAVSISLLPVYHRGYDRVIALVLAPAAMEIAVRSKRLAWVYAVLMTAWVANDTVTAHVLRRWRFVPQNGVWDVAFCILLLLSLGWSGQEAPSSGLADCGQAGEGRALGSIVR
jgi:hypothetical protein